MNSPTREVFGNISPVMQGAFYALMLLSLGLMVYGVFRRVRLWRQGQSGGHETDRRLWLKRFALYVLAQKRVLRRSLGGVLHLLLFSGFVVLTIGTTLLFISHAGPIDFHHGWYYLLYEATMDVFGVAFCLGCVLALYRRAFRRPASLGHEASDWALLALLLAIGVTGFLIEGLRIRYTAVVPEHGRWSVVGWAVAGLFAGVPLDAARVMHLVLWWSHAVMVAGLFVVIPHSRMLHVLIAPAQIATRSARPMGALQPITMEQVERDERIGVGAVGHFTSQQLMSLDACMACGRCEEACPAFASGKPLSPKQVVLDLRKLMEQSAGAAEGHAPALHGRTIAAETLWACTMCNACVRQCPVLIGHVDLIADMRRHLVGEGEIAGPPAAALRHLGSRFNPHGRPEAEREEWMHGLDLPTVETNPGFEVLLWVGCAAAFDPRARKIARALAQLMQHAKVNFAVLGKRECCTGDPARRLGDEFLFQQLAETNIATLNELKPRRIVTPCPHCMNTIRHEYRQFGGEFEVVHHTQFLAELVEAGRLHAPSDADGRSITLHDPCYLARVNGETAAQRTLLPREALREMPRHGERTFCCGAGGGRMWFEESPDQRVSRIRAAEAIETGATTVATACPFCLNMLSDAMAADPAAEARGIKVMDVAELLINGQRQQG